MLAIRLSRIGRKNRAQYRIVVQEKEWSPSSKVVEIIGHFDPNQKDAKPVLKEDRVKYWLSQGAQPSNTVWNMLVEAKLVAGAKRKAVKAKKKNTDESDKTEAKPEKKEEAPKKEPKKAE